MDDFTPFLLPHSNQWVSITFILRYICLETGNKMNKFLTISFFATFALSISSCEKCSTCTSVSEDPLTLGETLTTDVCDNGRDYEDQIEIYTRSGWECVESE